MSRGTESYNENIFQIHLLTISVPTKSTDWSLYDENIGR